MGLGIYSYPNEDSVLSEQNPFVVTFDGRIGGAQDKLVYVRNNAIDRRYTSIVLSVLDQSGDNIVDGSKEGWMWKLMEKDIPPVNEEWIEVAAGNTLSLSSDLGTSLLADVVTYLPVWIHVQIPRGQRVQAITDVILRLEAQEIVV